MLPYWIVDLMILKNIQKSKFITLIAVFNIDSSFTCNDEILVLSET